MTMHPGARPRARGWRGVFHRQPPDEVALHAACPARLGLRHSVRSVHEDVVLRDLFTQPGAKMPPVTESEVLTTSEGMRGMMDYYAHATSTSAILERLADLHPSLLACQH